MGYGSSDNFCIINKLFIKNYLNIHFTLDLFPSYVLCTFDIEDYTDTECQLSFQTENNRICIYRNYFCID